MMQFGPKWLLETWENREEVKLLVNKSVKYANEFLAGFDIQIVGEIYAKKGWQTHCTINKLWWSVIHQQT